MINNTAFINALLEHVITAQEQKSRVLVAMAGAPASGKSTLAAELCRRLLLRKISAVVVPMDGFHLDNSLLEVANMRARKGAPETFDANGYINLIKRLKAKDHVIAPLFDRSRDIAIAGCVDIPPTTSVIISEGNYLMFDEAPWSALADLWDVTVRIDVPMPELRARLIQRWLSQNHSRTTATQRAESNDIPNAKRVIEKALDCEMTLSM